MSPRIGRPRKVDERPRDEPTVAPAPSLPDSGPSLPDSAANPPGNAAVAAPMPSGPIQTPAPNGGSFGLDWSAIARWAGFAHRAADEFGAPPNRVLAHVVIESGGNPEAIQRNNQNGWSYGLMQVVPRWHRALIGRLAGRSFASDDDAGRAMIADPLLAIRAGAAVLRMYHDRHGNWDKASSAFFLGNPDWRGSDTVNGNTGAGYKRSLDGLVKEIAAAGKAKPDPWRPYPYPKMVDLIVPKPAENAGFTRCAFRRPLIEAFGTHITDGPPSQTIEFFRDFFGTGGQRAWDALTDLVIGYDGRIGLLNDWRDPNRGGTRAGWANGWGDEGPGFENGGQEFFRRFPDINVVIVSAEHAQKAGGKWSDAMLASTIEIRTALAQEKKIPAASYPINPRTGLSFEQEHRNFAQKSCPAEPYISTYSKVVIAEVKQKLAAWQGGDVDIPAPEPAQTYTRFGFTKEAVEEFFGTIVRFNRDGTTDRFGFDWNGALSLFWLKRAEATGVFPEAERIWFMDAAHIPGGEETWASFEGGLTAYLPAGERANWSWADGWTPGNE